MNKKYIFFDIDGTLTIKETGQVVSSVKSTIDKLKKNGHFVCLATGRAFYKTKDLASNLGIDYIISNGGAAFGYKGKLIKNTPLDKQKALDVIHQAQALGLGVLASFNDSIDVFMNDDLFIDQVGFRKEPTRYFIDYHKSFDELDAIYKFYVAISKEEEPLLTTRHEVGYLRFIDDYLIFQYDIKDQAIEAMADYFHADPTDVVVFGDDTNDLVMFKEKWMSIAMGNAINEIKEKASFITKTNKEDGIEYACKHFGWID